MSDEQPVEVEDVPPPAQPVPSSLPTAPPSGAPPPAAEAGAAAHAEYADGDSDSSDGPMRAGDDDPKWIKKGLGERFVRGLNKRVEQTKVAVKTTAPGLGTRLKRSATRGFEAAKQGARLATGSARHMLEEKSGRVSNIEEDPEFADKLATLAETKEAFENLVHYSRKLLERTLEYSKYQNKLAQSLITASKVKSSQAAAGYSEALSVLGESYAAASEQEHKLAESLDSNLFAPMVRVGEKDFETALSLEKEYKIAKYDYESSITGLEKAQEKADAAKTDAASSKKDAAELVYADAKAKLGAAIDGLARVKSEVLGEALRAHSIVLQQSSAATADAITHFSTSTL